MKILVTGGAGFIGSHVVDGYVAAGHEVVVVDNLGSGRSVNLNPAAKFYQVDITSPDLAAVFAAERPQLVNHHAAQIDVRQSVADPLFDANVNILGSIRLFELCRQYQVARVIYISTGGAVYGEPQYLPCDESHPINPICQYGISKHTVEHYLYLYSQLYGLHHLILRYPNVYGPRQDPHGEAGVVAIFTGRMLAHQPVTIFGDGRQERDFLYVGDCVQANLLALSSDRQGIFNLGTGRGTNLLQLFDIMSEITHYPHQPLFAPAKLGETRRIYLTAAKAQQELGWQPSLSLFEGLEQTIRAIQLTSR